MLTDPPAAPTPVEIRAELSRILASPDFAASGQLTRFLQYIVDTSLAGHADRIKERTVAIHALDRDADFDPRLDPSVRMLGGKLRRALERFYAGAGARHALRIDVPKGGYRPVFTRPGTPPGDDPVPTIPAPAEPFPCLVETTTLPVVAVVPFVPFSPGDQERLLADAMAQDLCVRLSRCTWFEVIDPLSARPHCAGGRTPIDVASRLHADFCLTGTVRRQGDAFRTTVQLTDTRGGIVLWAAEFDLCAGALTLNCVDQATERVVATIGDMFGVLATAVWARARTKPVHQLTTCEAVLCNLRYQSNLADGMYPEAMRIVQQALQADPDFAWGWAALATLHLDRLALVAKGGTKDTSEQSLTCIQRALKADPTSAFAHWTLALYHLMHGRIEETLHAAGLAVDHARGSPFELGAAGALMSAAGDHARGQPLIDRALEINPRLPGWIHWGSAINALKRGEPEGLLTTTRRFSLPDCFWDHLLRASALSQTGEPELARRELRRARQMRPELDRRPREVISRIVQEPDVQDQILDVCAS